MVRHRIHRTLLALRLLIRLVFPWSSPKAVPIRLVTPFGTQYDLYEPSGQLPGAHIILYGMNYAGEKNSRLAQLISAYVSSGLRVAVPVLPGFKSFDFAIGDLEILTDLIGTLHRQFGNPIRVTGFSIGAGLALVAAAQPVVNRQVDLLLLFSPHYSLVDVWHSLSKKKPPDPRDTHKWEIFVWHQLALAFHFQDSLELSPDEEREFMYILQNYSDSNLRAESFYREVLAEKHMPLFEDISLDSAVLRALSPEGKLDSVKARVLIIHDLYDERFPPVHSERIMVELEHRSQGGEQRLLATPLIAHSIPRMSLQLFDVFPIITMFGEIFATHPWSAGP